MNTLIYFIEIYIFWDQSNGKADKNELSLKPSKKKKCQHPDSGV